MALFKKELCSICGERVIFKRNKFNCLDVNDGFICASCKDRIKNLKTEKYTLFEVKTRITNIIGITSTEIEILNSKVIQGEFPEYLDELSLMDSFESLPTSGTMHHYKGDYAQDNIAQLKENERVYLVQCEFREDPYAVRVVNDSGKHLAWIPEVDGEENDLSQKKRIARNLNESMPYLCRVAEIHEFKKDNEIYLGFSLDIAFYL